jgi:hypothetical protein
VAVELFVVRLFEKSETKSEKTQKKLKKVKMSFGGEHCVGQGKIRNVSD